MIFAVFGFPKFFFISIVVVYCDISIHLLLDLALHILIPLNIISISELYITWLFDISTIRFRHKLSVVYKDGLSTYIVSVLFFSVVLHNQVGDFSSVFSHLFSPEQHQLPRYSFNVLLQISMKCISWLKISCVSLILRLKFL